MSDLPFFSDAKYHPLLQELSTQSAAVDKFSQWPDSQLQWISRCGIMSWGIPEEFGGTAANSVDVSRFYLDCSRCCLTTAFVLSQRNAAVSRLIESANVSLQQHYLPRLSSGEWFTTVGISHLSTSRQHLSRPAVVASEVAGGYQLSGQVPWVTGALHADCLLTGGTCEDGRQILVMLEKNCPGVVYGKPAALLALNGSMTGDVELRDVFVPESGVVAGPCEHVMQAEGGGTGSLVTSTLAVGVAARAIQAIKQESRQRPQLQIDCQRLEAEWRETVAEILQAESNGYEPDAGLKQQLRIRANSLVLRAAQAGLTSAKGAGFVTGHLAERTVREAMFFLVWSCPPTVVEAALREFSSPPAW